MPDVPPIDHVQLIMELGTLQADATQRGDDRAVDILRRAARALHVAEAAVSTLEARRSRDRQRPPRPRKSTESTEFHGIRGVEELRSSSSSLDLKEREETTTTPRASTTESVESAVQPAIDADVQQRFDMLRARMVDDFPAADEFVRRRPYATWKAWLDEMLSDIGPGSQYLPCDLARVCKDDGALERRIGSPRGLRSFLLNAREERIAPTPSANLPRPNSQQRALKALDGIQ